MKIVQKIVDSFNTTTQVENQSEFKSLVKEAVDALNPDLSKPNILVLTILDDDEFEIYRDVIDFNEGFSKFGSVFGANTDINTETFKYLNYTYCISFEEEI